MKEIEAKFLRVRPDDVRSRLRSLGAALVHPERLMRRVTFDSPDRSLHTNGAWLRVRDEGNRITLSYKRHAGRGIQDVEDITVTVDDFKRTITLLERTGLIRKSFQETKREEWRLGDVEVTIDTWPWIDPFVEIEGSSKAAVRHAAERLGFEWSAARFGGVAPAYMDAYNVTEDFINRWPEYRFGPRPKEFKPR